MKYDEIDKIAKTRKLLKSSKGIKLILNNKTKLIFCNFLDRSLVYDKIAQIITHYTPETGKKVVKDVYPDTAEIEKKIKASNEEDAKDEHSETSSDNMSNFSMDDLDATAPVAKKSRVGLLEIKDDTKCSRDDLGITHIGAQNHFFNNVR